MGTYGLTYLNFTTPEGHTWINEDRNQSNIFLLDGFIDLRQSAHGLQYVGELGISWLTRQ